LSTFFLYLGEAARPFTRIGQRLLPLLTPEYLHDVDGFSRRFFRDLFARLPEGATLVLDNYQEISPEQQFHQLIALAVDEVPASLTLIAVTRRDPPECYARLVACEKVNFVDWEALKLTLDEAQQVVANRISLPAEDVTKLHTKSGGWAAGLTLMLEGLRNADDPDHAAPAGRDAILDYFTAQIFDRVPTADRRFLCATAFLPQVSVSLAQALTGNENAQNILEDLYRRHIFTHRRPGNEAAYWYHALFRDFLKQRADQVLGASQCRATMMAAAGLLAQSGQPASAFQLYCESCDWEGARKLVLSEADGLIAQARWQTLRDWILVLPEKCLESDPWLWYWLGVSQMAPDQQAARDHLERAFNGFSIKQDIEGQARAASAIIQTHFFEWSQWKELDRWIDALEILMLLGIRYTSLKVELDVLCSMLIATLYRKPGHCLLSECVNRVDQMLDQNLDVNRRVAGATLLLTYANLAHKPELALRIIERTKRLIDHEEVTPLNRVWWYCRLTWHFTAHGLYGDVEQPSLVALNLIERHGLKGLRPASVILRAHYAWGMMGLRNWKRAQELVSEIESMAIPSRLSDLALAAESRIRLLICRGELDQALSISERSISAACSTGMVYMEILERTSVLEALAELGKYPEAREHLQKCYATVRGTHFAYWETELRILEAFILRGEGEIEECHRMLRRGFAGPDAQWRTGRLYGRVLAAMCAQALDADIEVERVRALVRRLGLRAPAGASERWPWRVKVYVLGNFDVLVDDAPLRFEKKAPRRPLALLKALLACGGRNVPEERLTDALWPDEEADAAKKALDVTMLRLRKLLGDGETITVSDERVSLNPQLCWTDVWELDRGCEKLDSNCRNGRSAIDALQFYRGNFLPADEDVPWTVKARERLRGKFVHWTEAIALQHENAGDWGKAIGLYSNGLEADDLVEVFYQGLMRCYRAQGRYAEAMSAYRRLRHLLSVVLGVSPSESSQQLAQSLQRERPANREPD
jgi:LuxR family transcriptional regulator, maltose regulon positive regulatory protein